MTGSNIGTKRDRDGYIFLDANGDMFTHILHFLRNDTFDLPDDFTKVNALRSTISYFNLPQMMERLEEWIAASAPPKAQLIEVLATVGGFEPLLERDAQSSTRYLYVKVQPNSYYRPVVKDDNGKDFHWFLGEKDAESVFDEDSMFGKLVKEENFTSPPSVMAALSMMDVR